MCSISQSLNLKKNILKKSAVNVVKSWIYDQPGIPNVPHSNGRQMTSRERYKSRREQEQELIDNYLNSKR